MARFRKITHNIVDNGQSLPQWQKTHAPPPALLAISDSLPNRFLAQDRARGLYLHRHRGQTTFLIHRQTPVPLPSPKPMPSQRNGLTEV